jgi:hypothetical protein
VWTDVCADEWGEDPRTCREAAWGSLLREGAWGDEVRREGAYESKDELEEEKVSPCQ